MPPNITTLIFTADERGVLDTGYALALELSNDQNHRAASKHWRSIKKRLPPLATTSYVFDEVVTYFNSRGYHTKAVEVGNRLLRGCEKIDKTSNSANFASTKSNSCGYSFLQNPINSQTLRSPSVQFVQVDEGLFREGWHYFQQHQDKDYSLTDCISFVVMKRFGIETAFAFDQHFVQAGFKKVP